MVDGARLIELGSRGDPYDFYSGRQQGHVPLTTTLNGYKLPRAEFMIRRPISGSSRKNITYDDVGRMFRSYRGK